MRGFRLALLWAALCVAQRAGAQEAALDCAKPESWAEQMVCSDNELTEIHVRLHRAYEDRRRQLDDGAHADLVSYQRGWLRGREECRAPGDAGSAIRCLKDLYATRLAQLTSVTETRPAVPIDPDPTLVACRGDEPSWSMELGASSARLRFGLGSTLALSGRLSILKETYAWRGAQTPGSAEVMAIVLESACTLGGNRTRFPLLARVSLPDGTLAAGCCQRTPLAALREPPRANTASSVAGEAFGALLPAGTKVRLRDVDGATVALRKSARISSGNILAKVKAGQIAIVEQATAKEGMNWYFIAFPRGDLKGWVMGELVEPQDGAQTSIASAAAARPSEPGSRTVPGNPASSEPSPVSPSAVMSERWAPLRGQWWRSVLNYLPVIDACIQKTQARTASVVSLEATKDSLEVFLRDSLHQRIACRVQPDGAVQARAVDMDEPFPSSSGPIFTRAPGNPPNVSCYSSQRVIDAKTRSSAGWLSYLKPGKRCR